MKRRCIDSQRVGEPWTIIPVGYVGKGEPNGMFYVHRRNSSSRTNLIQSSLSRVRGSKNTTGMGGVKGNVVTTYKQFMHGTPLWLKTPCVCKRSDRRPPCLTGPGTTSETGTTWTITSRARIKLFAYIYYICRYKYPQTRNKSTMKYKSVSYLLLLSFLMSYTHKWLFEWDTYWMWGILCWKKKLYEKQQDGGISEFCRFLHGFWIKRNPFSLGFWVED